MHCWCLGGVGVLLTLCLGAVAGDDTCTYTITDKTAFYDRMCTYFYLMDYDHNGNATYQDYLNIWRNVPCKRGESPITCGIRQGEIFWQFLRGFPLSESMLALIPVSVNEFLESIYKRSNCAREELQAQLIKYVALLFRVISYDGNDAFLTKNEFFILGKILRWDLASTEKAFQLLTNGAAYITREQYTNAAFGYFLSNDPDEPSKHACAIFKKCPDIRGFTPPPGY